MNIVHTPSIAQDTAIPSGSDELSEKLVEEISLFSLFSISSSSGLSSVFQRTVPRVSFWMQGVVYYVFLLYCLVGYRDARELCFYCKYSMYVGGLYVLLGVCWVEQGFPTGYLAFVLILLTLVILHR
jgi:hypothetical protein